MDDVRDLGKFLQARRARISPTDAGLPSNGRRRVPGLRREELSLLAGVSVDYYTRLEQGRSTDPSSQVLTSLARALNLDDITREHLFRLAAADQDLTGHDISDQVRPQLQTVLDSITTTPALIFGHRMNVLAANKLAQRLYEEVTGELPANMARHFFLHPRAEHDFPCLEHCRVDIVGQLRLTAAKYPNDTALIALVAELTGRSDEFLRLWKAAEVNRPYVGTTTYRHPESGVFTLHKERFVVDDGSGQELVVLTAPEQSAGYEQVRKPAASLS